jgi:acetylornithine deacetylase
VGTIQGGNARNILAKACQFHWEFRGLPSLDPDEIPARFQAISDAVAARRLNRFGDFGRIVTELEVSVPSWRRSPAPPPRRWRSGLPAETAPRTRPSAPKQGLPGGRDSPTVCVRGRVRPTKPTSRTSTSHPGEFEARRAVMRRLAALLS